MLNCVAVPPLYTPFLPPTQAAPLAPQLGRLVLEGCSKAAARLDGLLALVAAARIAGADLAADGALEADKVR